MNADLKNKNVKYNNIGEFFEMKPLQKPETPTLDRYNELRHSGELEFVKASFEWLLTRCYVQGVKGLLPLNEANKLDQLVMEYFCIDMERLEYEKKAQRAYDEELRRGAKLGEWYIKRDFDRIREILNEK